MLKTSSLCWCVNKFADVFGGLEIRSRSRGSAMSFSSPGDALHLVLAYGMIFLVVAGVGYIALSVVNGVALWYASRWLRMPLRFGSAFHASWLANLPVWVCGVAMMTASLFRASLDRGLRSMDGNLLEMFSPWLLFFAAVGAVLAHATIYMQVGRAENGEPIRFGQAAALSFVALALDGAVFVPLTLVLLVGVAAYF
jgi:hypothetical protein